MSVRPSIICGGFLLFTGTMETFNAKDYEEKLRIERKLKKEFKKEDMEEQQEGCGPVIVVFFVIFLFCCMAKCVS